MVTMVIIVRMLVIQPILLIIVQLVVHYLSTRNMLKTWWPHPDHDMNHAKHGSHTMAIPWIMAAISRNMVTMPSSWHDHHHASSPWSWYDYGKIMAWHDLLWCDKISSIITAPARETLTTATKSPILKLK